MRIVTRKEFLGLAAGVIYSPYERSVCTGLFVKHDTLHLPDADGYGGDWIESSLEPNCWEVDDPPTFDEDTTRNSEFVKDQLFAVFEAADLELFKRRLSAAVPA